MSVIVSNIRLPFTKPEAEALHFARKACNLAEDTHTQAQIYRCSIDARRGQIYKVYSVCITGIPEEQRFVEKTANPALRYKPDVLPIPTLGNQPLEHRPIIIGFGPAGLFAAYELAKWGYRPLVFERGKSLPERDLDVDAFFQSGIFRPDSNIQFGEGGAGAYSDGKLTTRINDVCCESILQTLVQHGAPREILTQAKPHIGTDILKHVVTSMREAIVAWGGEVHFSKTLTGLRTKNGRLIAAEVDGQEIPCVRLILAIGHSARDTFAWLPTYTTLEPKAFSIGARIEHLQTDIDQMLYGKWAGHPALPPAEYVLSHRTGERACYSFCMCPGGHVVAAQSEEGSVVTNGMSYHARDGKNANSAIVVSVSPADFGGNDALAGVAFQRQLERQAFAQSASYLAPCVKVSDFLENRTSKRLGKVHPTYPLGVTLCNLTSLFPAFITKQMQIGLRAFDRKMRGFASSDAILTAPETRTSSPVRIVRDAQGQSPTLHGCMPCGEGAGYAGGIMSAAVDGLKIAHQIIQTFAPF